MSVPESRVKGSENFELDLTVCNRLFVYGTLLSSMTTSVSAMLHGNGLLLGQGTVPGSLYSINAYCGLSECIGIPNGTVRGEIYQLDSSNVLAALDEYEGYDAGDDTSEFERVLTIATANSGDQLSVWVYRYAGELTGKRLIESGDFSTDAQFSPLAQRRATR